MLRKERNVILKKCPVRTTKAEKGWKIKKEQKTANRKL